MYGCNSTWHGKYATLLCPCWNSHDFFYPVYANAVFHTPLCVCCCCLCSISNGNVNTFGSSKWRIDKRRNSGTSGTTLALLLLRAWKWVAAQIFGQPWSQLRPTTWSTISSTLIFSRDSYIFFRVLQNICTSSSSSQTFGGVVPLIFKRRAH